jgi:MFS transporter, SET family, sugar efflux transporter
MTDTGATRPKLPVTAFLAANLFLTGITYASTMPYTGIVAIDALGMSNTDFAIILIVGSIVSAFAAVAIGFVSDKVVDRRRLIILIALLGAIGYGMIYVFRDPISYIVAFCVIMPFGGALFSQSFSFARVYYNAVEPTRAEFLVTMLRTVFAIAWVVIPPVAGWIAATYAVFDVFAFAAVAYLASAGIFALMIGTGTARLAPPSKAKEEVAAGGRAIDWPIVVGILGIVLISTAIRLNGIAAPLAIVTDFGGTLTDVGVYSALAALLEIPLMVMWGYLAQRFKKHTLIIVSTLIFAIYLYLLGQANSIAEVLWLQILNAIATAALMSIPISYIQEAIKGRVGLSTSLLDVVFVVANLLSAALFAAITTATNFLPAFGFAAMLCVAGVVVMAVAHGVVGRGVAPAE